MTWLPQYRRSRHVSRILRIGMTRNILKLNAEKTEVLYIAPSNSRHKFEQRPFQIDDATVHSSSSARNMGVIFDETLSLHEHISVCKSCIYHLRKISAIHILNPQSACESLTLSLVTSRLDYANSLFAGLPKYEIGRLQKTQNIAARVIFRLRKFDHVKPALRELHWLPVAKRIEFMVLLLTFQCIHGNAPAYLQELIELKTSTRCLR